MDDRIDLSLFVGRGKKRFRKKYVDGQYPADSEIAKYLTEKARVDAIYPNVPVCIVLDDSAILETGTLIEDIIDAFRYAPRDSFQIIIPLYVIEKLAGTDVCEIIASRKRHITLEHADLSLLPIDCQNVNGTNMTLAVAAKNAVKNKFSILISNNTATRIIADSLGIKAMDNKYFANKLSSFKQYWENRWDINHGVVIENLDWGTILPLSLYSEMSREEYENCGYLMVEDGEEVVPKEHTGDLVQRPQDHMVQKPNKLTIEDWVRNKFHPNAIWDWFGLIYILYHSGQIKYEFNAEKIKRELIEKYPEITPKVPDKLNASRPMIYVKIIENGELVDRARDIWMEEAQNIKVKDFGQTAANESFLTIKQLLPQYLEDFGDSVNWK